MTRPPPPPAEGVRLEWLAVPDSIRHELEQWARSTVISAESQRNGFSPGVAARLRLADGRRLFVKAVGPEPNAESPGMHRREARIVSALPNNAPVPRLRWSFDAGEQGWVVLVFDDVHGRHPAEPWRTDELDRVLDGLAQLAEMLTPSPLAAGEVSSAAEALSTDVCGWQRLRNEQSSDLERLDAWSRRHVERLSDLEALAPAAVTGDTLLHFDVRADNLLLAPEHVWFFVSVALAERPRGQQPGVLPPSSLREADSVVRAVQAGAMRYLLNESNMPEWWQAIKAAVTGQVHLSPEPAARLARDVLTPEQLSRRELDVLRLVAGGHSNKRIAHDLMIAENTVKSHVSSILGKLGVESRTQAALYCARVGLVTPGAPETTDPVAG